MEMLNALFKISLLLVSISQVEMSFSIIRVQLQSFIHVNHPFLLFVQVLVSDESQVIPGEFISGIYFHCSFQMFHR